MLKHLVDFQLNNRWVAVPILAAIVGFGAHALMNIPIDAFPDLTPNQVTVITECPAMPPVEVEQLVSYPVETALMGIPHTEGVRSISKLGLSMVILTFDDSVNTYLARQLVNERLNEVRARLPEGIEPRLGPIATAFGEVYQYTLESESHSAMDLKTIHEWQIKNQLRAVRGVGEVNTWGGETAQYQVIADPYRLDRYGLTLRDVFERLRENNANFGGGYIEHAGEQYTVRGLGRVQSTEEIGRIVLAARGGRPIHVHDVAEVRIGPMQRQGATLREGRGETVSGMAIMLKGENGMNVIQRVKDRIASLRLPEGVRIVPFYDQSTVIDGTIRTVRNNLVEGGLLVVAILLLFLGNIKAALVVASVIPLSMLVGFLGMQAFGVSANLMSLGAVDFGLVVDGAVVMMENSVRRLSSRDSLHLPLVERVRLAAHDVARPIVFAVGIIVAVYIPIFTLEGLEGRLFRPMAITVCTALLASLLLALTVVPAAATVVLRGRVREARMHWFDSVKRAYERVLRLVLRHRLVTVAVAAVVVAVAIGSVPFLGSEFMPRLDEGSLLVQTMKLPGISLSDSVAVSDAIDKSILEFPEVTGVVTKLGRPDLATEAMGIYEADTYVLLKPREEWTTAQTREGLIEAMAEKLETFPGVVFNFTQPMAMRLDEVVSGIKADVALKIFGEDARMLEQLAHRAAPLMGSVRGAADVRVEVISGVAEVRVETDREALARYGINVSEIGDLIQAAVGGRRVGEIIQGQRRFDLAVRLPERYGADPQALGSILVQAPGGERLPLNRLARIHVVRGPEVVARENGQRRIVVQANVRGRDLGGFAEEAQRVIAGGLALPAGYSIDWGGQFENQQRASRRLMLVVPLTILIVMGLLYANFKSMWQTLLIMTTVPFASVGGIAALWVRDMNINLSGSIGFIALFGIAVMDGIVMVSCINGLRAEGKSLYGAVIEGAVTRLRPVLMTSLVASLGFLPMALATSTGAEVQRPLATVVIGGLISSTLLTLLILPVLYPWFSASRRERAACPERESVRAATPLLEPR